MKAKTAIICLKRLTKNDKHISMNVTNVNPSKKEKLFRYLQDVEKLHIYFLHIN